MKRTEESEDIGYQEHLPYRCGWQMQKAGKSTGQVIKVYMTRDKFWAHSLKGNPEIHFLSFFLYEEIFYVDTLSFSVLVRLPNPLISLGKGAGKTFTQDNWGFEAEREAWGFLYRERVTMQFCVYTAGTQVRGWVPGFCGLDLQGG